MCRNSRSRVPDRSSRRVVHAVSFAGLLISLVTSTAHATSNRYSWNFDLSCPQSWAGTNATLTCPGSGLHIVPAPPTPSDPQTWSPGIAFQATAYDYMRILVTSTSSNDELQIFFKNTAHPIFSGSYTKTYNISTDGTLHYFTIPLNGSHPYGTGTTDPNSQLRPILGWTDGGDISQIRVDPAHSSLGWIEYAGIYVRQDNAGPYAPVIDSQSPDWTVGTIVVTAYGDDPPPVNPLGTNPDLYASGVYDFGWSIDGGPVTWERYNGGYNVISGRASYTLSFPGSPNAPTLSPGSHTLTLRCMDRCGITGAVTTRTLKVGPQPPFTISASAGPGGSISPSGSVAVNAGSNITFTITPSSCSSIDNVVVDGTSIGAVSSHTFTNVQSNHTISASFSGLSYTLSASAGPNCTISPYGVITVGCGDSQTFTFGAASCYTVANVVVDGASVGTPGSYTFSDIRANHSISVSASAVGLSSPGTPVATPGTCTNVNSFAFSWGAASPQGCVNRYEYRIDGGSPTDAGNVLGVSGVAAPSAGNHTFAVRAVGTTGVIGSWSANETFCYTLPDLGLRANPNGFKYCNPPYPACCYPSLPRDPTWAMFEQYFGSGNVRLPNGKIDARAWSYFTGTYALAGRSGFCVGLSACSGIDYFGLSEPNSGAFAMPAVSSLFADSRSWPLWPWDDMSLANPVLYYQATQTGRNVMVAMQLSRQSPPSTIYQTLLTAFLAQQPIVLIMTGPAPKKQRHAVLPFNANRVGNIVSVGVYDPNLPGNNNRVLQINLADDTWSYRVTVDQCGSPGPTWTGTATSKSLEALSVSEMLKRGVPKWTPTYALTASLHGTAEPATLLLLTGDGAVTIRDSLGNVYSPDSLDMGIEPIVPVYAASYDSVPHGYELPTGTAYDFTYEPTADDSAGFSVVGPDTYFHADAKGDSVHVRIADDSEAAELQTTAADTVAIEWARYVGGEQRMMRWNVTSATVEAHTIDVRPAADGASVSLPPDGSPVRYSLTLEAAGDSLHTQTLPPVTLLPGQTHEVEAPQWESLDSADVIVNVIQPGDTTASHQLVTTHPELTIIESEADVTTTAVFVELQPPWSQASIVHGTTRLNDVLPAMSDGESADFDGDGLREYLVRFDRPSLHELQAGAAMPPRLTGTAVAAGDTVYFSGLLPGQTTTTAVGGRAADDRVIQPLSHPGDPVQRVRLVLPHAGRWRLYVHDVSGRRMATVMDQWAGPGAMEVAWHRDANGRSLSAGVYFYKLTDGTTTAAARKLPLLR